MDADYPTKGVNIPRRSTVTANDITTNLPYVEGVHLCFDHHASERKRVGNRRNLILDPDAPSAARVVYDHFGGPAAFPLISTELMQAVDRADAAQYTMEDILSPEGWTLLNFMIDPRTGLDAFQRFDIGRERFIFEMMTYCRHNPIKEILLIPDIEERVHAYSLNAEFAEFQLRRCASEHKNLVIIDLRREEVVYPCNRFMVYALYPECNISMQVRPDTEPGRTLFAVGKSILDRSSATNVGFLMLEYGGGGHAAAGSCRADDGRAETVKRELIERINADG